MEKKNFAYSLILTLVSYVSSLIVFPHVSRVLGVEGLGRIDFVNETINYFLLFAMLGVNAVGTREIAACNDKESRTAVYSSIFSVSLFLTCLVLTIYGVGILFLPLFQSEQVLFCIGASNILFTALQVEWLFRGMEDFKYITLRSVLVRGIYIVLVLLIIREPSDYLLYFILTIAVIVANAIINQIYSQKHVKFNMGIKPLREGLVRYFKPIFTLGTNNILNSFYSTFNVVFLGMVVSKVEVGYYYVSNKIMSLCLGIMTSFTMVMLPRMSSLIGDQKGDEYNRLMNKSLSLSFDLCVPLCIGLFCYAPELVRLLSGDGFERSVIPLRIISPVIFINAIAQILVFQVEMPMKRDKPILISSVVGAVMGVFLNLVLVKDNGVIGSAIVLCCSVGSTFVYNFTYCLRHKLLRFPFGDLLMTILMSLPIVLIYYIIRRVVDDDIVRLLLGVLLSISYWAVIKFKRYKDYIPFLGKGKNE